MLSVANNPNLRSVIGMNVVMLNVVVPFNKAGEICVRERVREGVREGVRERK